MRALALPAPFQPPAEPVLAAANDAYIEVMVGGISTVCLSRDGLARMMLRDCLAVRENPDRNPKLVFASNGHAIALASQDAVFRATLEQADIIHADGQATVFASRLLTSNPIPERSATTDFIHDAAKMAAEHGLRFFLLGATEEANADAVRVLRETYPGLQIVGRRHGYFGQGEEEDICDEINLTQPDVIWAGLSVPLEYEFAVRNKHRLKAGWLVTCGGCYNFVNGAYKRAPQWMQTIGLEWLFRLSLEPRRLFWRYAVTNPLAVFLLLTRTNSSGGQIWWSGRAIRRTRARALEAAMTIAIDPIARPAAKMDKFLAAAGRYALSASGPVATSGAHFLISLVFMRNMFAAQFGLFSFVMVIVPFCMSMIAAALSLPITRSLDCAGRPDPGIVATSLKMNILLCGLAALLVFAALTAIEAPMRVAAMMGLYSAAMSCRWFLRCFANAQGQVKRAVASDWIYAVGLLASLGFMEAFHHVHLTTGATLMLLSALAALIPFGPKLLFRDHLTALRDGRLRDYGATFRDLTRWSLLGVILTEITVNAHAYLVTFLSGPGPFALLALGQLLMRPISLVQGTLPDIERPVMTRQIKAGDMSALQRVTGEFRLALLAVWLGTVLLAAVLLLWFPDLLLRDHYGARDVIAVTTITAAIMLARNFRAPLATLLQAAGAFKALAHISGYTSVISILATLILLITLGPIHSLGGILLGELVTWYRCHRLVAQWRARHAS